MPAEPKSDGQPIDLIVLFGGQSAEHDVSRMTAAHVLAAADPARYRITPIGISRDGRWALAHDALAAVTETAEMTAGELAPLPVGGEIVNPSDALVAPGDANAITVVMPLLHGPMGEDGTVQGFLELLDVAYVGDGVLGSAVAMDKTMAKTVFSASGIPQARYRALHESEVGPATIEQLADEFGFPLFVKPANMGSSVGISKVRTADQLHTAIQTALSYDRWIVVEEAIDGREIEVAVIGNEAPFVSVPGEIQPADDFYSYADKYLDGTSQAIIPADLDADQVAEVKRLALNAYRALRCEGLARVDFFLDVRRGFLCNEINTMPGFTPISMFPKLLMASGWTYPQIIDRLVDLAIERHAHRRRNTAR